MSDAEPHQTTWMKPADRAILDFLADRRADYPAIIASRVGVHAPYVERRCDVLRERGYVEKVSDEVVYRITALGVDYLDTAPDSPRQ